MKKLCLIIKKIHLRDLFAPIAFLLFLIPSWVFRLENRIKKRNLWLISEHGEARDNGYHFYKYIREKHPEDYCFYAININDPAYKKVAKLGNLIKYGGLKHWLYYMSADLNISSQKSGNPSPVFFGFIHEVLGFLNNRVFLQHGITHNDAKFIYYSRSRFKYFVCGAKEEYEFVKNKFGYPESSVLLTGFPRWDNLKDISRKNKEKTILVMPTWRNWLGGENNSIFRTRDFNNTEYYKYWNGFLNDKRFVEYIEKNKIKVYFYPHYEMRRFLDKYTTKSKNIKLISVNQDIQEYFNKCNLMITDYSSVAFDFAYLKKPVIYFQFDKEKYRKLQFAEGYFKYEHNGFGPVCETTSELVEAIKNDTEKVYLSREIRFFERRDNRNCERLYEVLK